jgi:hypothetical protein
MHTFDYAVRIAPETTVVIDTVVPDSSSVNAALVLHLDRKNAKQANIRQQLFMTMPKIGNRLIWRFYRSQHHKSLFAVYRTAPSLKS